MYLPVALLAPNGQSRESAPFRRKRAPRSSSPTCPLRTSSSRLGYPVQRYCYRAESRRPTRQPTKRLSFVPSRRELGRSRDARIPSKAQLRHRLPGIRAEPEQGRRKLSQRAATPLRPLWKDTDLSPRQTIRLAVNARWCGSQPEHSARAHRSAALPAGCRRFVRQPPGEGNASP